MLSPVSFAFICAKASNLPISSRLRLKSLNFTACFINSISVTVPCVSSLNFANKSPLLRRSKASLTPSASSASLVPSATALENHSERLTPAVIAPIAPPNFPTIPTIELNEPLKPVARSIIFDIEPLNPSPTLAPLCFNSSTFLITFSMLLSNCPEFNTSSSFNTLFPID